MKQDKDNFIEWEIEENGVIDLKEMNEEDAIKYIKDNAFSLVMDDEKYWVIKVNGKLV